MIIIEGCDNTGKSTLAAQLGKDLEMEVHHSIRPEVGLAPHNILEHARRQLRPRRMILDRVFAISEYVYGRVLRGRSLLLDYHAEALIELYNRPYLIIYCRPKDKVIMDNRNREQMDGVVDNFPKLIAEYDELIQEIGQMGNCKVVYYDYTLKTAYGNLLKAAKDHMKNFDSQCNSATYLSQHKGPVI